LGQITIELADAAATRALGGRLAHASPRGMLFLLRGPLGAGKTTLVEGFVRAIGAGATASPTFVLARGYTGGSMPVSHLDLYRLDDPHDVEALDLPHYLLRDGATLVEWPERADHAWPRDRVEVVLAIAGASRRASLQGFGAGEALVAAIAPLQRP
jgi:tRNA threonylcarbamoyladenosine biosynthesis protein TsaE